MGSVEYMDVSLRDGIESGYIIGPKIIRSARAICTTGGHGWKLGAREADGVEGVRKAVREQLKAGADNIKIMASGGVVTKGAELMHTQFSLDELKVAVEEARKAGKTIAAHSHPARSIKDCIIAGIDSIQHGIYADDEAIRMMSEMGVYLSPTLMAPKQAYENPDLAPEWLVQKVKVVIPIHRQNTGKAYRSGVKIALGSDAGARLVYHGKNLRELSELVGIGMTAHEAILSATRNAAKVLGLEDQIGSVRGGKLADIIIIDGNPLDDIRILEDEGNIGIVIKGGKIIKDSRSNIMGNLG
jgi:imidazolonepropionase-like amidohydrolase